MRRILMSILLAASSFAATQAFAASASLTIATSNAGPAYGQSITLTVALAISGSTQPSVGQYSIYDGTTALVAGALPNTTNGYVFATSSLGPGLHTLTAKYVGSENGLSATSGPVYVDVTGGATAAPAFSLAAGTYSTVQTVSILDSTPGAMIYYTVNGTAPTVSSTRYTAPVAVRQSETLQAIAVATGDTPSSVTAATYKLVAGAPVMSPAGGAYTTAQRVTISSPTPTATIFYTTNGTYPTTSSARYTGAPIAVSASEHLNAIAAETGFTTSATTLQTYLIGATAATPVASLAQGTYTTSAAVSLSDATAGAAIHYTLNGTIPTAASPLFTGAPLTFTSTTTVKAIAIENGYANSAVATWVYSIVEPAPTPVVSPGASEYPYAVTVTITDAIPGANIRYTLDGSTPTVNSIQNIGSFSVAKTTTIKAIAFAPGYASSAVASATFTISIPTRVISTVAGSKTSGYGGDGGPATSAKLNMPRGIALDKAGNIYIADTGNNVVRKLTLSTGDISTIAGNGSAGYSGDGLAATKAELNQPYAVALDSTGNLFIADSVNQVIREVTASTGIITTVAGKGKLGTFSTPVSLAIDSEDNLYIGENGTEYPAYANNLVYKANFTAETMTVVAGSGSDQDPPSGFPATSVGLFNPYGIVVGSDGDFTFTDWTTVLHVSASTSILTVVAGDYGNAYDGDGGLATLATLYNPWGVALDRDDNLLIADASNNVIREVFADTGIITTVAGNGYGNPNVPPTFPAKGGYTGDGGPAANAEFNFPTGLAIDSNGDFYIADTYNNVIRKVTVTAP